MVKPIMRDVLFLGQKSIPATEEDLQVGRDLQDTLAANREACVGMAANMIGVKKRIIIVNAGFRDIIMFNPVIVRKSGPYDTEEGCLSLPGVRKTKRPLRNRRRLPFPARRAENKAVPEHRNRILRLELEKTTPEIHRLASPDLPA